VSTWALVPLKARAFGKQRLVNVIGAGARARLIDQMLSHVLGALKECPALSGIAVVTADPDGLPPDVLALTDPGPEMNAALLSGLTALTDRAVERCVVVCADLPRLSAEDVSTLLDAGGAQGVALAPDRHGRGTNALALSLPTRFHPHFGPDSLARHRREAAACGLPVTVVRRAGLEFDVDEPEDLALLSELDPEYSAGGDPQRW
jgi:2-phospho-L-lactate/phosphoenolpyruvate guanylyltransferase